MVCIIFKCLKALKNQEELRGNLMGNFLKFIGILVMIGSIIISTMVGDFWFIALPTIFTLGAITMGIGRGIDLLEEIKDKNNTNS